MCGLSSSSYSVLKLRYRDPYSDYKIFSYPQQNHSSVTLFTICVYDCLINILYTLNFIFLQCSKVELYIPGMFQTSNTELLNP